MSEHVQSENTEENYSATSFYSNVDGDKTNTEEYSDIDDDGSGNIAIIKKIFANISVLDFL